jgi:hypothetical protein
MIFGGKGGTVMAMDDGATGPLDEAKCLWTALVATGMDPFEAIDLAEVEEINLLAAHLWTTLAGFKDFVAGLPETDANGRPYEVWVEPSGGLPATVTRVWWDGAGNLVVGTGKKPEPLKCGQITAGAGMTRVDLDGALTVAGLKVLLCAGPQAGGKGESGRVFLGIYGHLDPLGTVWPFDPRDDGQDLLFRPPNFRVACDPLDEED